MDGSIKMSVSQVFGKGQEKYAFVSFADGERNAEGKIPDCKIISSAGFSEEETARLEEYMREELSKLKRMAAGINVFSAMMKE